jgi:ubiquinone/menaquinone biosynthesis C-methylase UbiE
MSDKDTNFAGSIPEIYDSLLVPLLFEPYAQDLAKRIADLAPRDVLELAAGTGVVTRAMAARLSPDVRIVATDLNQPMLDRAMTRQPSQSRIAWQQADALALPFPTASFDVVVCQFGAMFFPDKVKGYSEARRVLRTGGHYCFNVWDRISENDLEQVATEAVATLFPNDPPMFLARTPHGYHDVETIRQELATAGFVSAIVEPVAGTSRAASSLDAATAICQGTPMRNEILARDPGRLDEATSIAADALARRFGTGPIDGRMKAYVITASA